MRGSRAIAAVLGTVVLTVLGGAIAATAWNRAAADASEDSSDEIIRTGPASIPDLAALAAQATPAPPAEVAAVRTETAPVPVEWAAASAHAADSWARPRLVRAQALAARYESRLEFKTADADDGSETRVTLGLGPKPKRAQSVKGRLERLGVAFQASPEMRRKGRWFLFAAGSNQAFGMNWLRNRDGELRRAGFSAEKIAAVGDGQIGVGWRKGSFQTSLGMVEREISAYGRSARERFVAFTVSIRPPGYKDRKGAAEGLRRNVRDPVGPDRYDDR